VKVARTVLRGAGLVTVPAYPVLQESKNQMEIYTLKISFAYGDKEYPWSRTIEVREDFTLNQLHNYIQRIIDFDNDHLYEFYIGKTPRNRASIIPLKTKLNEIFPITGFKLFYLFDFGDNWLFKIMKSRKKKVAYPNSLLPLLVETIGENPEQYEEWEE